MRILFSVLLGVGAVVVLFALVFGLVLLVNVGILSVIFWCLAELGWYTFTGNVWVAGILLTFVTLLMGSILK